MAISEYLALNIQPRFSFVAVFRERIEYTRYYNLPFNMIAVCSHENADDPSWCENMESGERFLFHENDVSLTTCGMPGRYRYSTANEHLCIHFRLELFPGVDVFSGMRNRIVINDPALAAEGKAIFADWSDPARSLARCEAFALKICDRNWPSRYPFELKIVLPFERILAYIRTHVNATMEVSALAAQMKRSEGYFTRSFHHAFHMSPKQFLQNELFSRAAYLLLDPETNVKTVAEELQFSSEFYFSRFFKRMSGVAPRDYRKHADILRNVLNP